MLMRRFILFAVLAAAVIGSSPLAANAGASCPSGSIFVPATKGHGAGGKCVDTDALNGVKDIRSRPLQLKVG